jgi:hypothetical protein
MNQSFNQTFNIPPALLSILHWIIAMRRLLGDRLLATDHILPWQHLLIRFGAD